MRDTAGGAAAGNVGNGWTSGLYSLFRAAFGLYLFVHFVHLLPWGPELFSNRGALPRGGASPLLHLFPNLLALADSPLFVQLLLALAAALSLLLAVGWHDRPAAGALWYLWACFFGRNPLIANPALPYIGWLLLAHAVIPPVPYGSWASRGRTYTTGAWNMPQKVFVAAWILMALGYSYSGFMKLQSPSWLDGSALACVLENPLARPGPVRSLLLGLPPGVLHLATWGALGLELGFAPLALLRRLRPWVWLSMLGMHLGLILVIRFPDLTSGMVILHAFTFDPAWIPASRAPGIERLFYDGHCGLCHRFVRFVLFEDRSGSAFRFAPLQGDEFQAVVPPAERGALPDSLVVRTIEGRLLTRSTAVIHLLGRLGGVWRLLGGALVVVPRGLRDAVYDGVAHIRYRLFGRPADVCPLVPADVRARFDN
jgi:predicted DCC family thiol-disulfide oxidoreductase YuxK